jgi:hypothetical protein
MDSAALRELSLWVLNCSLPIMKSLLFHFHLSYSLIKSKSKCKGKIVPVLLLTEHHAMKAYWGSGGIDPLIL